MGNELSFTLPARDFGRLAERYDVLKSQWAGVDDETLKRHACWHLIDPRDLKCVHCGATTKWLLTFEADVTASEKANAALLLRLRQLFAAIDQPTPYWDFDAIEQDRRDAAEEQDGAVAIRVILAPVAKLAAPPQLQLESRPKTEFPVLTEQQMFGPSSVPGLFPPLAADPNALQGGLEAGCMCAAERRRASSIAELASLAGKVHPLCPIHGKRTEQLPNASEQLTERTADLPVSPELHERYARIVPQILDDARSRVDAERAAIEQPAPDWSMPQPIETEQEFAASRRILDALLEDARATGPDLDHAQLRTMAVARQLPTGEQIPVTPPGPAPTKVEPAQSFVRSFTRWLFGG